MRWFSCTEFFFQLEYTGLLMCWPVAAEADKIGRFKLAGSSLKIWACRFLLCKVGPGTSVQVTPSKSHSIVQSRISLNQVAHLFSGVFLVNDLSMLDPPAHDMCSVVYWTDTGEPKSKSKCMVADSVVLSSSRESGVAQILTPRLVFHGVMLLWE